MRVHHGLCETTDEEALLPLHQRQRAGFRRQRLRFALSRTLLAGTFASQACFDPLLPAWLQLESVPLNLLDDVLLQDLSLKALERALQALAIVKLNFCQRNSPRFPTAFAFQLDSFPLDTPTTAINPRGNRFLGKDF